MTDTLGVHVAPAGIAAVRHVAEGGDETTVVALGDAGPVAACSVVQDAGGAVLVGDAAAHADGPHITDPLERAAAGRPGALVAVLNHVVGRATTTAGNAPRRLAIVIPDDWELNARNRIVAAGVAAGVADTVVVPVGAASVQPVEVEPELAIAAGAARVAGLAAAPIVTREDLGDVVAPPFAPTPDPETPSAPVSVFDTDEEIEVARPVPATGATSPPVPAAPASSARMPPPASVAPEALRYEPPERRWRIWAAVAVVLVALIAVVGAALVAFRGDDEVDTSASTTTIAPPTSAPTTSVPPSTTDAASTTTSSSTTSTSTTSTTTTSTTSSTTTTTMPTAVAEPGPVTLVETGLQFDTGTVVRFDQDAEVVIEEVRAILGAPDDDRGWQLQAFCEGARTRFVRWGGLELVFTEDELETGEGRFTQWYAGELNDPTGLVTRDGLGVTATVGFLEVTYGDALAIVEAMEGEEIGLFAVTNPGSGGVLNGTTSSLDPEGRVIDLWAGDSCSRVFT